MELAIYCSVLKTIFLKICRPIDMRVVIIFGTVFVNGMRHNYDGIMVSNREPGVAVCK